MAQESREVKLIKFQRVVIGFLTTVIFVILSLGVYDFVVANQVDDNTTAISKQAMTNTQQGTMLSEIKDDVKGLTIQSTEVIGRLIVIETKLDAGAAP